VLFGHLFDCFKNWLLQLAKILGFKNFSEYALTLLCAKTPENVEKFLDKLADKMRILQKKELEKLLNYKKQEVIPFFFIITPILYH
jgi:Zn-dependent oligopeptidase